jgi:hypothetical protein
MAAKKRSPWASVAGIIALIVCAGVGRIIYTQFISPQTRNEINQAVSITGIPIVPWADRARTAADSMYKGPNGATIAQSIRTSTHPTGTGGKLASYTVRVEGDQLVSRFDVGWNGGLLNTSYVTSVEWRCSQAGHVSSRVIADSAMFNVAAANAAQLDGYFSGTVFPALVHAAN